MMSVLALLWFMTIKMAILLGLPFQMLATILAKMYQAFLNMCIANKKANIMNQ